MEVSQFTKLFLNESTQTVYKTLKAAKAANRNVKIYRCWLVNNMILKKRLVYAYGDSVCTIREADELIWESIQNKI